MEYLDYYDELGTYLGYDTRENIHKKGLWHNTIHCWLYDIYGNIYFQIRKDTKTFYTTASGHVKKGETIPEAFRREIKEEIGINIDTKEAIEVDIVPWQMNKLKKDGTLVKDRAKAHVYLNVYKNNMKDFNFDKEEVLGLVKVNAQEALNLFKKEHGKIKATVIIQDKEDEIVIKERKVDFNEFLVNPHETAYQKYGRILEKIIKLTKIDSNNIKVISLTQPYATLIANGQKHIETRSWKTNYRGELYIHASLTKPPKEWVNNPVLMPYINKELPYGQIICKCNLVDCICMDEKFISNIKNKEEYKFGIYEPGRYAWILKDITILDKPIIAKGHLNIWTYKK